MPDEPAIEPTPERMVGDTNTPHDGERERPSYLLPPPHPPAPIPAQGPKDPMLERLARGMVDAMVANLNAATARDPNHGKGSRATSDADNVDHHAAE